MTTICNIDPKLLGAFVLGVVLMFLFILQQANAFRGRWKSSFFTSLAIDACVFMEMHWVATNQIAVFIIFAIGAASGAALGTLFHQKYQNFQR